MQSKLSSCVDLRKRKIFISIWILVESNKCVSIIEHFIRWFSSIFFLLKWNIFQEISQQIFLQFQQKFYYNPTNFLIHFRVFHFHFFYLKRKNKSNIFFFEWWSFSLCDSIKIDFFLASGLSWDTIQPVLNDIFLKQQEKKYYLNGFISVN